MRRAVTADFIVHDHIHSLSQRHQKHVHFFGGIQMLPTDLPAVIGKVDVHIIGQLRRAFHGSTQILPVLRDIPGFLQQFTLCDGQPVCLSLFKGACGNLNQIPVIAIEVFSLKNDVARIIQRHDCRSVVDGDGVEVLNGLPVWKFHCVPPYLHPMCIY